MLYILQKFPQLIQLDDVESQHEKCKQISRKHLINKVNYVNFQDGTILVNFAHVKYHSPLAVQAKPLPCLGDRLDCNWLEPDGLEQKLKSYSFQNILVTDGQKLYLVEPPEVSISEKGISFLLPDNCSEIRSRKIRRHECEGVRVQLIQNSALFSGYLVDFNAVSFRVEVTAHPPQTFQWMNTETPAHLILSNKGETLFSGECRIIKQTFGQKTRIFVLEAINQHVRRFKPKEFRSTRQELVPSPNIIFRHPFTGKLVNLEVVDLSGSGFAVDEEEQNSILLSGMIIPELELNFASSFKISCKAQVIYRTVGGALQADSQDVRCGLTFLDMPIDDHVKLLAHLYHAKNKFSYMCSQVDMDALWNFFFETGFIYPKKYAFIKANKEKLKDVYERLYTQNPHIARHFIYQSKGVILGHMAMLRFYENTWLIQHHAASRSDSNNAGLVILNQIGRFINDSHRLYSAHMNFVSCYFRPDNKFPSRVFGGATRNLKDPKGCSVDTFAYFHHNKNTAAQWDLTGPWRISKTSAEDLMELERFYEYESGGLMIHALDLEPGSLNRDELSRQYEKMGFRRERYLFSLKREGNLKAVVMMNISDVGLNLSDLVNCIKVIVLDADELPSETLFSMLSFLSIKYRQDEVPILLYPVSYCERYGIIFEKMYNLWILNMQYTDHYFKYLRHLVKTIQY